MVAERYDGGCDNGTDRPASPATRIRMNETPHATDDALGVHPGDTSHGAIHGDGDHVDAAHGGHVDAAHGGHAQGAPLGPVDWAAWGAGLLGIAAGLVVAACLYLSTAL
jgi:hypothetical protein